MFLVMVEECMRRRKGVLVWLVEKWPAAGRRIGKLKGAALRPLICAGADNRGAPGAMRSQNPRVQSRRCDKSIQCVFKHGDTSWDGNCTMQRGSGRSMQGTETHDRRGCRKMWAASGRNERSLPTPCLSSDQAPRLLGGCQLLPLAPLGLVSVSIEFRSLHRCPQLSSIYNPTTFLRET